MRTALLAILLAACSAGQGDGTGNAQPGGGRDTPGRDSPGRDSPGGGPCVAPLSPSAFDNCDFGPAERLRGVWVTGFERSGFVPGASAIPDFGDPTPSRIWLAFAPGIYPDPALRAELDKLGASGAVAIEFVGRRSRGANAGRVVVVDRIIAARILGPLRRR